MMGKSADGVWIMQYEKDIVPIIRLHYENLSHSEKTVADFFIRNKEVLDFSAKNIASLLYTSEATLSRFAKKCGFRGYRQFVYQYRETLGLEGTRHVGEDTRHILGTYQELLTHSYSLLDENQIKKVAGWFTEKRRVFLYGKGSSGVASEELQLRLMRLGIDVTYVTDDHIMIMNAAVVEQDCLVVGVSVSGKTPVVMRALQTAKAKGATTVLITAAWNNAWNDFCDEVIPVPTKEMLDLGKLISPQFPILILFDLLYVNILQFDRSGKEALHSMTLAELNAVAPSQYSKEVTGREPI